MFFSLQYIGRGLARPGYVGVMNDAIAANSSDGIVSVGLSQPQSVTGSVLICTHTAGSFFVARIRKEHSKNRRNKMYHYKF